MRYLHDHKTNGCNSQIRIEVLDLPGHGGANHDYRVVLPNGDTTLISFQNGPILAVGTNGLTHEVLLAILIDRMRGFQSGLYNCLENQLALNALQQALDLFHARTQKRAYRGVEGTHAI